MYRESVWIYNLVRHFPLSSRYAEASTDVLYLSVLFKLFNGLTKLFAFFFAAIQLMRNSYNTVDDLDFVAMDEFQKDFFLFRQNEWDDYRGYHPNVMQGDLSDPVYFDFISFCQYAVIANKARNGKLEFVEKVTLRIVLCVFLARSGGPFIMKA